MARKRMISPEIWESQDFSQLSDIAKIVFISLFSHADDEGRGRADPTFIKNITFPYDENRRVADIKSALSEIARCMSVQFYSVNGIEYCFMTSWERWQKIDRPSKSKFPPPPNVGVGGDILNYEKFDEGSTKARRRLDEGSSTNTRQDNVKEENRIEDNIKDRQTETEYFLDLFNERLRESELEIEYKARFEQIVTELIRKESYIVNKASISTAKLLQSFVYLLATPDEIPDLLYAGDKVGVKNKFLYTISALYNSANGF